MNKAERLAYMKRRFKEIEASADAVLPVTKRDVEEEVNLLESAREYERDKKLEKNTINSDER